MLIYWVTEIFYFILYFFIYVLKGQLCVLGPTFLFAFYIWLISSSPVPLSLLAGDISIQRGYHVHQQHVPSLCSPPLHRLHPVLQGKDKYSSIACFCISYKTVQIHRKQILQNTHWVFVHSGNILLFFFFIICSSHCSVIKAIKSHTVLIS